MITDPELDRIVAGVHSAVLQPEAWATVVRDIARTVGAHGACLFTPEPTSAPVMYGHGSAAASVDEYMSNWAWEDEWIAAARDQRVFTQAGEVARGIEVLPTARLRRTAFHSDFLRRYDIEDMVSMKVTDATDPVCPVVHLSLFLPPGDSFDPDQLARLRRLWPHLQHALQARWLIERGRLFDQAAVDVLDALPEPALVLRQDRHIEFANAAARELLSTQPWLQATQGRLTRVADLDDGALASGHRHLVARLPGAGQPLVLHVVPLHESPTFAARWPRAQTLLLLRMPATPQMRTAWRERLAAHYRLTPAELRVLERLVDGHDLRAIADLHGVATTTVRTQLQALLTKTGCTRQVELVLLAASV